MVHSTDSNAAKSRMRYRKHILIGLNIQVINRLNSILSSKSYWSLYNLTDYSVFYPSDKMLTLKIPAGMREKLKKLKYSQVSKVAEIWSCSIEAEKSNLSEEDCQRQLVNLIEIANNTHPGSLIRVRLDNELKTVKSIDSEAKTAVMV